MSAPTCASFSSCCCQSAPHRGVSSDSLGGDSFLSEQSPCPLDSRISSCNFRHTAHFCCCSVTKLCLTLRHHGLQHAGLLCPSPPPRVCSDSCPLTRWCYPTISSSATLFSNYFILCYPLLLLPSIFPRIRVFSSESVLRMSLIFLKCMLLRAHFSWTTLIDSSGFISTRHYIWLIQKPLWIC